MKSKKRRMFLDAAGIRTRLAPWFRANARDLPWRRTVDPYAILVSEVMLQQTQVATVIDYYHRWMRRFPDFSTLAAADESEVMHAWAGLGYYSRVRNLHRAARQIVAAHGGNLPNRLETIAALPGVGSYTSAAVASFAFDSTVAVIDTNVTRVLARLLNLHLPIDTARARHVIASAAHALLPSSAARQHNSALMELGALVCTSQMPRCSLCPLRTDCAARDPRTIPRKKPRRKTIRMIERCALIRDDGMILLEKQTGRRWRGLWKLPVASDDFLPSPLATLSYAFTHHRVELTVYQEAVRPAHGSEEWVSMETLSSLGMASAHRRALVQLIAPS